jgi:hypothetical protein
MSKAITEKPEAGPSGGDWQVLRETAPSLTRADEPVFGRIVGFIGLMCLALGGTALLLNAVGWGRGIGPLPGSIFAIAGVAGLLFHAVCDSDLQVRRIYGLVGFLWLAVGALVTALPIKGPSGAQFLPYGYSCGILSLLFLLPVSRHETDPLWRRAILYTLGVAGGVFTLVGFVGGSISEAFLSPYGLLLAVLGLAYLWAFVSIEGTASDLGYRTALFGMGLVGLLAFLIAAGRSLFASRTDPYFMPSGLLLMGLGALYVMLAAALVLDNRLIVLTRRELAAIFFSPIAYFVLFGLTIVGWYFFYDFVGTLYLNAQVGRSLTEPILKEYLWGVIPIFFVLFMVPVLTMRLLSEEQRTGTLEVLFTAPLGEVPVVLSKFLAVFLFYLLLWVPWGLFLIALRVGNGEPFEYRPLLTFYLMQACIGAGFLAMGLFFSSLTRNQIIAAVLTFAGMLLWLALYFIKWRLENSQSPLASAWLPILNHMSFIDLWFRSTDGVVLPQNLIFHLSAAVFWLFLTVKVLESRKWR